MSKEAEDKIVKSFTAEDVLVLRELQSIQKEMDLMLTKLNSSEDDTVAAMRIGFSSAKRIVDQHILNIGKTEKVEG